MKQCGSLGLFSCAEHLFGSTPGGRGKLHEGRTVFTPCPVPPRVLSTEEIGPQQLFVELMKMMGGRILACQNSHI